MNQSNIIALSWKVGEDSEIYAFGCSIFHLYLAQFSSSNTTPKPIDVHIVKLMQPFKLKGESDRSVVVIPR